MKKAIQSYDDLSFSSCGDMKWHLSRGAEIEFIWNGKYYVTYINDKGEYEISEGFYEKGDKAYNALSHTEYDPRSTLVSSDIEEIFDYIIDGKKLRNIATEIGIVNRNI